jgi:4'-phosphopantetheinyl transferase EntD
MQSISCHRAADGATSVANPAALSPLLAGLFPAGIAAAELRRTLPAALLLPEEQQVCSAFAPKRVREFTAGRVCAHRALAKLGISDFPIGRRSDRRPHWPDRIIGSITHTADFVGAVVAPRGQIRAIGVDAEQIGRVTSEIIPLVCTSGEVAWLDALPQDERRKAATIIFSAKEAFYKCQYEVREQWLDFHDIALEFDSDTLLQGSFAIRSVRPMTLPEAEAIGFEGRFQVEDDLVVTGVTLMRAGVTRPGVEA